MFPLQSFNGCITSMQTSSSMEIPNTDKECLKYLRDIFPENCTLFSSWLLREFSCQTSTNDHLKKIYNHIGNTHLKHTNKMAILDLRKNEGLGEHPTIKSKLFEGGI